MGVSSFMARQYARPSGVFGRIVIGRLLNRANAKSNEAVFKSLNVSSGSRVLEIGFGGGELLFNIHKRCACKSIHGIETSSAMLKRGEQKKRRSKDSHVITLTPGSVDSLPFEDDQFDRVCSVNTVYFWPDLVKSIKEVARVTEAQGVFVLGFGSDTALRQAGYEEQGFILRSPEQIQETLAQNGFDLVDEVVSERKKQGSFYIFKSVKTL